MRKLVLVVSALMIASTLSACGDTWRGAKQDTKDNMQATGQAIDRTGRKIDTK